MTPRELDRVLAAGQVYVTAEQAQAFEDEQPISSSGKMTPFSNLAVRIVIARVGDKHNLTRSTGAAAYWACSWRDFFLCAVSACCFRLGF